MCSGLKCLLMSQVDALYEFGRFETDITSMCNSYDFVLIRVSGDINTRTAELCNYISIDCQSIWTKKQCNFTTTNQLLKVSTYNSTENRRIIIRIITATN